jgi:HlyD family secretion protein
MDVVPEGAPLVIEAKVKPNDADDLRVGQATEIRIPAFRDRRLPLLTGYVRRISADALTDEKSGTSYFTIEVEVPPAQLAVIRQFRGAEAGLKPGLPVEVVVPLRNRTALDYLVEPLREMLWRSFRQR